MSDFINSISNISMMTEEEKSNASLIKEREEYKNTPISVYFGSAKEGLTDVCTDCKEKDTCEHYAEIKRTGNFIHEHAYDPFINVNATKEDMDKIRNNVFIVINCKIKNGEE